MPDYQRGKIYKITSGDLTYIGSTTEPTLARRLADHTSKYNRWKKGILKNGYTSYQLIEKGQCEITLLELCPCGSKDELRARERFYIETTDCVNKNISGRTLAESCKAYREANLDKCKAIDKAYWDENKDKINERRRQSRKNRPILS